jgi:threonine/homoserine/homoserine lactone efflux protein
MIAYGAALSEAGYATLACMGLATVLARYPWLTDATKLFGGVVLAGLGLFFLLRSAPAETQATVVPTPVSGRSFVLGLSLSGLNPTLLATWASGLSMVALSFGWAVPKNQAGLVGLGAALGIGAWFTLETELLRRFGGRLRQRHIDRVLKAIGAGLVIAGALQLASRARLLFV